MFHQKQSHLPIGKIMIFTAWLVLLRASDISADSCRKKVDVILNKWEVITEHLNNSDKNW